MNDDRFRSRKFMLSAGIQVFASLSLLVGLLNGDNYSSISQANIVAYSFANAAEYFNK